jgi:uncharacterized protein (UPF0332 family)
MAEGATIFLAKAQESLAGAASEYINATYNNCANRCYYASFQAAVAALMRDGIQTNRDDGEWAHAFVQSQFSGVLIGRRKRYCADFRDTLQNNMILRRRADYQEQYISEIQAERSLQRTEIFVGAIQTQGGETR